MPSTFDFCLPTRSTTVPSGSDWYHGIKFDGYRLRVEQNGDRVRVITRGGYAWTKRYPQPGCIWKRMAGVAPKHQPSSKIKRQG